MNFYTRRSSIIGTTRKSFVSYWWEQSGVWLSIYWTYASHISNKAIVIDYIRPVRISSTEASYGDCKKFAKIYSNGLFMVNRFSHKKICQNCCGWLPETVVAQLSVNQQCEIVSYMYITMRVRMKFPSVTNFPGLVLILLPSYLHRSSLSYDISIPSYCSRPFNSQDRRPGIISHRTMFNTCRDL